MRNMDFCEPQGDSSPCSECDQVYTTAFSHHREEGNDVAVAAMQLSPATIDNSPPLRSVLSPPGAYFTKMRGGR